MVVKYIKFMKLSENPDHVQKVMSAVFEQTDNELFFSFNPKLLKWLSVARFRYENPDAVQRFAKDLGASAAAQRDISMSIDDYGCRSFRIRFLVYELRYLGLFPQLISDYLVSCNLEDPGLSISISPKCVGYTMIEFDFQQ